MELNHLGLGVVILWSQFSEGRFHRWRGRKGTCVADGVKCGWVACNSFPGTLSRTEPLLMLETPVAFILWQVIKDARPHPIIRRTSEACTKTGSLQQETGPHLPQYLHENIRTLHKNEFACKYGFMKRMQRPIFFLTTMPMLVNHL